MFGALLKREFSERKANLIQKRKDIVGTIFNAMLVFVIVLAFASVFSYLTKTYSAVKVGYITNKTERVFELLTVFYFIVLLVLVLVGISKLNKSLINVGNLSLLSLPVTPFQIFLSKLIMVAIDLVVTCLVLTVPVVIIYVAQGLLSWTAILVSLLFSLLIPVFALGVASIFTIPFYYLKTWLNKHFIIQLAVYVLITVGAFYVYSIFLEFLKGLMESGQIQFFFNEDMIKSVAKFARFAFPTNMVACVFVGKKIWINLLLLFASVALSGIACFFLSKFVFYLVRHNKLGINSAVKIVKRVRNPRKASTSLVYREFVNVLRTPSYAFSYFAIILALPLMIVVTSSILISMINNLTLLNFNFEVVLCTVCMYSILLNSFCANNISRDGKFFNLMKTYPVSSKSVMLSKILFCSFTTLASLVISSVTVVLTKQLSWINALEVLFVAVVLNFSVICLATRKDLNTAPKAEDNENPASANFIIFFGLIFSVAFTVVSFLLSILLKVKYNLASASVLSFVVLCVIAISVLVISLIYLLRNLDRKYKETML